MKQYYYRIAIMVALISIVAFLGRFAEGAIAGILLLFLSFMSLKGRTDIVLSGFMLLPILLTLSPIAFPMSNTGMIINRMSTLIVAIVLVVAIKRSSSNNQLPLGMMIPFLVIATISSTQGYFPPISYFKLINFFVFVLGIWVGTKGFDKNPKEMETLRIFILAIAVFIIVGSLLSLPFPVISYRQNLRHIVGELGDEAATEAFLSRNASDGIAYFCGITNQSQCLGPLLAALILWLIGDMLFVEKRFEKLHTALIVIGIGLMYLTRSRTALFAFTIGMAVFGTVAISKVKMSNMMRRKMKSMMAGGILLFALVAIILQLKSGLITHWIRKTNDTSGDVRDIGEAITESRQGLIEQNWNDFHYNEVLGCGFQVAYFHPYKYANKGFVFSAPIEKGILPLMVLGETGVVGFIVFLIFIIAFYVGCKRRSLYMTMALFTTLLASNIGEADFFSPGGIGGAKWVICVVGGFAIDSYLIYIRRCERYLNQNII